MVPDAENRFAVAAEYTWLGIEHIWIGIDHLLFVACLLFIARTPRRLLITITGFTIAHSITLSLAALDIIRLPSRFVESVIAISIVLVALNNIFPKFHASTWIVIFVFGRYVGMAIDAGFVRVRGRFDNDVLVALETYLILRKRRDGSQQRKNAGKPA